MPDETKIQPFDPEALKKRISESVQSTFGMLIPQDQFDALVAKEIKAFFEDENQNWDLIKEKVPSGYYSNDYQTIMRTRMTAFRVTIRERIAELVDAKLKEALDGETLRCAVERVWHTAPGGGSEQIVESHLSALLTKKLDEIAPKMAASMFQNMFAAAVGQAKGEIINELKQAGR